MKIYNSGGRLEVEYVSRCRDAILEGLRQILKLIG